MIVGRVLLSLQRPLSLPGPEEDARPSAPLSGPGPPAPAWHPLTVNQCGGGERLGERRPLPRAQFKSSFVSEKEQERKVLAKEGRLLRKHSFHIF